MMLVKIKAHFLLVYICIDKGAKMKLDSISPITQNTHSQDLSSIKNKDITESDNSNGADNAWFSQLLANLTNKSLDQIADRLKDTPHYLEQIELEYISQQKAKNQQEAPLYAVKSGERYMEEIIEQNQIPKTNKEQEKE